MQCSRPGDRGGLKFWVVEFDLGIDNARKL